MTEEKKDLTSLFEISESSPVTSSESFPIPSEVPSEPISSFESLEEASLSQVSEPSESSSFETQPHSLELTPQQQGQSPKTLSKSNTESFSQNQFEHPLVSEIAKQTTLEQVKQFSEKLVASQPQIPAAFSFSLRIRGVLQTIEKEKLIEILDQEKIEIRDLDLQIQFENHNILIPRISEYVGIMIVQALRTAHVDIQLGPSEQLFTTQETKTIDQSITPSIQTQKHHYQVFSTHAAENIPLTMDQQLPHITDYEIIDIITASALLKSHQIEIEISSKYLEIIESLKKELQYKAHRKGASGIVQFQIKTTPLQSPSAYRILALGTAIRNK